MLPCEGPYPQFFEEEYPRIFVSSLGDIKYLQRLEEQEQIFEESRLEAMQIAEEKRIQTEAKKFLEQIHRQRLKGKISIKSFPFLIQIYLFLILVGFLQK